jgi:hypothetical protein
MKKKDIPHDPSALNRITKEMCYVVDDSGKYTTELSEGWEIKSDALNVAWHDVEERIAKAKQKVLNHEASPLLFFMEYKLMDIPIVAAYTGFWKWRVKQHLKPSVFNKLSEKKLQKYADIFEVSVDDFKNMNIHEA